MTDQNQNLERCRLAEKEQALFYRAMAADAEQRGDEDLAGRFHDLHADEQHHLSRLTARLIELGHAPADLRSIAPAVDIRPDWETIARDREHDEVRRYESLLQEQLDEETRRLVEAILGVERSHAAELGGKWTLA
jgi:rubrerythrin